MPLRNAGWRSDHWDETLRRHAIHTTPNNPPPVHVHLAPRLTATTTASGMVLAPTELSEQHPVVLHLSNEHVRLLVQAAHANRLVHALPPALEFSAAFHLPQMTANLIYDTVEQETRDDSDAEAEAHQTANDSQSSRPPLANSYEGQPQVSATPAPEAAERAERRDNSAEPGDAELSEEGTVTHPIMV